MTSEGGRTAGAEDRCQHCWLDVTSLFHALRRPGNRPTGIPRVVFEVAAAARQDLAQGQSVRLVRYDAMLPGFREVDWAGLDELLDRVGRPPPRWPPVREVIRRFVPGQVLNLLRLERRVKDSLAAARRSLRGEDNRDGQVRGGYVHPFADGDCWINLGNWWHAGLVQAIPALRREQLRLRTAVLIHDCIPLVFPEFFRAEDVAQWRRELPLLPDLADIVLVSSENTGRDVAEAIPAVAEKVRQIRFGDAFGLAEQGEDDPATIIRELGLDRPYVLIVGTIEVRKNHQLALRAWRSLARRFPDRLPLLVFAGKWGWKTADLREQIRDSNGLDGRLIVVEGPSDAQMDALYRGATMTLYPSLYEGWGLPVRESLAYGKVCLAARNSSIPEAGGECGDYFENNCQTDLERKLEHFLFEEGALKRREAEIAAGFRANNWDACWAEARAGVELS